MITKIWYVFIIIVKNLKYIIFLKQREYILLSKFAHTTVDYFSSGASH